MEQLYVDKFGFIIQQQEATQIQDYVQQQKRQIKWESMISRWSTLRKKLIKKRVRKGIPDSIRATAWRLLLSISQVKAEKDSNYYNSLLQVQNTPVFEVISLDIGRTFPQHILFRSQGEGRQALQRVLQAYSIHDSQLGYCQGMGFIIGVFLMHLSQQDSFWALDVLMQKYKLRSFFMKGMEGIYVTMYQLNSLIKLYMPMLWRHFKQLDISPTIIAPAWIMPIYLNSFPPVVSHRIFDIYLNEGPKFLLKVFLGILKTGKKHLKTLGIDKILDYLRNLPELASKDILKTSCTFTFSRRKLNQLEQEFLTNPNPEFKTW